MTHEEIYKKAIKELFHKTYGKFEHDEKKAIELFDKLISSGIESHCDTVKKLCLEVGYHKSASEEIAQIYDIISLYKSHKKSNMIYWDIDKLLSS